MLARRVSEVASLLDTGPAPTLVGLGGGVPVRSAALETGGVGRAAIQSLVSLQTAADFLTLTRAQAAKLRHTVAVSNLRALEAQNVVKYLQAQGSSEGVKGQLAGGPGFGLAEEPAVGPASGADLAGSANRAGLSALGGLGKLAARSITGGSNSAAVTSGSSAASEGGDALDGQAMDITDDLRDVVESTYKAKYKAERLAEFIGQGSEKADTALRAAAEELNLPGFPVNKTSAAPCSGPLRPAGLTPSWMDFIYASRSPGADPYQTLEGRDPFDSMHQAVPESFAPAKADLRSGESGLPLGRLLKALER